MSGLLSDYFDKISVKRLSAVETEKEISNQHEFNGVTDLRKIFGDEQSSRKVRSFYLTDENTQESENKLTWYDSRKAHPTRSEYRLYYDTSEVTEKFSKGDLMIIAEKEDGSVVLIAASKGTTAESQLMWLFGIREDLLGKSFEFIDVEDKNKKLELAARRILEDLNIELIKADDSLLEEMLNKFNKSFPKTEQFSEYARLKTTEIDPVSDPDSALYSWINLEEELFKTLEKHFVEKKLIQGFGKNKNDVDDFIDFSLSVQNRRKSRVGYALEHHLKAVFDLHKIKYSYDKVTEGNKKPDFLFPGIDEYKDPDFPSKSLLMLGAKSSCKDRWRQVLSEADRIKNKHLLTLEPSISTNQTDEMKASNLKLVVPSEIKKTYSANQQSWLMTVSEFISLAKERQNI